MGFFGLSDSEKAARAKAQEILRRRSDAYSGDEYGAGHLTKAQRKSQERHIPMREQKNTRGAKIKRALID